MKSVQVVVAVAAAAVCGAPAWAGCLEDATTFAVNLCGDIERSGFKQTASGKAEANASLSKLIRQFVDVSGGVGGQASIERYEGVGQQELAKDRFDARSCRQNMAKAAIGVQCKKDVTFNTCARREFGLSRWGSEVTQEGNSGWMDGGKSESDYCSTLQASVIKQHEMGSEHEAQTLSSSQGDRKDILGHVEYNYKCHVKVMWNPIYKAQTDPLCGIAAVN